jgi:formate/nitrite transporter FocA (FNT family)
MADADKQRENAEQRTAPTGAVVYKAICSEGQDELERSTAALAWSGLAAGLSMGFTLLGQGVLRAHLPDASWSPLVVSLGYSLGYLVVILGRQQLFTENTLTVILPLLQRRDGATVRNVARLWVTVFLANMTGAWLFALVASHSSVFEADVTKAFIALGEESMRAGFATTLLRGIFAGWLVALIVWLMPFAESARIWVIVIITWLIGVAGLSHVIAGSVETMFLAFHGTISWVDCVTAYVLPSLIGNIIGGVALVAALNHAQVVAGGDGADL